MPLLLEVKHLRVQVEDLRRRIDRAVELFVAAVMALLVVNVLWQVATRFLLNRPSAFTEGIARYGLVWLGVWGAALAFSRGLHPSLMEAVVSLTGGQRVRRILTRVAPGFSALFALLVLLYGGVRLVLLTHELGQKSAALGIPLAWVYAAVPLSGVLILFYSLCDLFAPQPGYFERSGEEEAGPLEDSR